jgi:hypothetical protein
LESHHQVDDIVTLLFFWTAIGGLRLPKISARPPVIRIAQRTTRPEREYVQPIRYQPTRYWDARRKNFVGVFPPLPLAYLKCG